MTVSFKTFGCRLNRAETNQFEADFTRAGFQCVPFGSAADMIILHTCAITQKAESACIKQLRSLRQKHPDAHLVVVGCAIETVAAETLRRYGADLIVPRSQKESLAAYIQQQFGTPDLPVSVPRPRRPTQRAILKIQDGCDFFCSYCIVPHTRGTPRSRPRAACVNQAREFVLAGFQEIVVTGCNIACYRDGDLTLVHLLQELAAIPGLGRLRLGSLEPGTVERDVIALMADTPTICPFLHLPIQSGDNEVLARMRRRYRRETLVETLNELCSKIPHIGLGADLITGFPGETEAAFLQTRALVSAFPFSNLHVFPYSERPGTPAAAFTPSVPMDERRRRANDLIELGEAQRLTFAKTFVGRPVDVVVERIDPGGVARGWTGEYLDCHIRDLKSPRIGHLAACVPYATKGHSLLARPTQPRLSDAPQIDTAANGLPGDCT